MNKPISQAQLARQLGISPAMVCKLAKRGMPVSGVEAAAKWRSENLNLQVKVDPAPPPVPPARSEPVAPPPAVQPTETGYVPDYQESRARREAAEAELAELKVMTQRGQLIEKAPVMAQFAKQIAAAREALLNMSARLAPILAAETDMRTTQTLLDAEIRAAINAIAEGG